MIKREPEVRYDLVVFDLDVLSDRDVEISAVAVFRSSLPSADTVTLLLTLPMVSLKSTCAGSATSMRRLETAAVSNPS